MKIFLNNSAHLQNITSFLNGNNYSNPRKLEFSMHDRWVSVHPVVLALTACAGASVIANGGQVTGEVSHINALSYLVRMKLFDHIGLDPGHQINAHDESGRFVPLMQIRNSKELSEALKNLVPLLHAPAAVADPIRYVFSEMVRNTLEHSESPVGAFVCAQYYPESNKVSIGIADAGRGVLNSMRTHHKVQNSRDAIMLALQPGISGATSRIGGNETNAGAGLFFTKSIAALSHNFFMVYSGDAAFRLMRGSNVDPELHPNAADDRHKLEALPKWPGTVVGIDIGIEQTVAFSKLLSVIHDAYQLDVKKKKNYAKKIRFAK